MRLQLTALVLIQPLLLCTLAVASSHAEPSPSPFNRLHPTIQLPLHSPQYSPHNDNGRSWFSRATSSLARTIWWISLDDALRETNGRHPEASQLPSQLPPNLSAQYGGDLVLRFQIKSHEEAEALAGAVNELWLDVWESTTEWVDIRLSKDVLPSLLGQLPLSLQHAHTPLMHDLAQAIFESYPSHSALDLSAPSQEASRPFNHHLHPSSDETNIFFREYQPLSVILPWMRLLRSLFPTHVRMINIGYSYEGREIPALRLGVHPTNSEEPSGPRKTIIITGGSHAREWISTSSVNYAAYSFITAYGKSKSTTKLLEEFDWVFIPTLNPDGYVYTWENDRLWRKNRQQTALRFCKGVDLDRTYGFEWDSESSKSNPCSESFSGDGPFEGVESRRFANWVRNETEANNVEIVGFLDFHSYSQQVLYPYSYSCTSAPPSLENLEELAIGLAKAIRVTNGETYGVTSACEGGAMVSSSGIATKEKSQMSKKERTLWPRIEAGGGSALDWFYHEVKVPYAYQIKLRDTGSYGFLLPSKNIVPTGNEALHAIEYLGQFLMGNKGIESQGESEEDAGVAVKFTKPDHCTDAIDAGGMAVQQESEKNSDEKDSELRRRRRR